MFQLHFPLLLLRELDNTDLGMRELQVTEEQAEEIAAYIEDNSDAEVEIHEGNQPVYSFIIGVE